MADLVLVFASRRRRLGHDASICDPMKPLLQVRNLRVYYHTLRGPVKAVEAVNFGIKAGERFGLIGESGSGKSTLALSIMRLIKPPGRIESGEVLLDGVNVMTLSEEQMRQLRLAGIALISQGAMNSLNPVMRISPQIVTACRATVCGCPNRIRMTVLVSFWSGLASDGKSPACSPTS